MNRTQLSTLKGFSLIELMIAMMVFSLLAAFAYRAVSTLSLSSVALESEQKELVDINKALNFIARDMRTAKVSTLKLVQDTDDSLFQDTDDSFDEEVSTLSAEVTDRGGVHQVVAYGVREKGLFRTVVKTGIEGEQNAAEPLMLLKDGVSALDVELLAASEVVGQNGSLEKGALPIGVSISLEHQRFGRLSRTIYINLAMADLKLNTLVWVAPSMGPQILLPDLPAGEEVEVDPVVSGW